MSNVQIVSPNSAAEDGAGWCLRFTQTVFRNVQKAYLNSAWDAWKAANHPRTGRPPSDVVVPIYFEHWGDYDKSGVAKNWGHIAAHYPNGAVLSSPAYGYGQQWFSSIEEMARVIPSRYVGWSYDLVGGMVADVVPTPPQPEPTPPPPARKPNVRKKMFIATCKHAESDKKQRWYVYGSKFWLVLESASSAEAHASQLDVKFKNIPEYGEAAIRKFQGVSK